MKGLFLVIALLCVAQAQYRYEGLKSRDIDRFRSANQRSSQAWERSNGDLVRRQRESVAAIENGVDAGSFASQLRRPGVAGNDDQARALAQGIDLRKSRQVEGNVFEQEVNGRVIRYQRGETPTNAPVEDICVTNPDRCQNSLGIPRYAMPQFYEKGSFERFVNAAKKLGYAMERREVRLGELGVTQSQVLDSKVDKLEADFRANPDAMKTIEFPTIGNRILDGHHRFQAALRVGGPSLRVKTMRIFKRDPRTRREVPMTDEEARRLVRLSTDTKGVVTEGLSEQAQARATLVSAFSRRGSERARQGQEGFDARREYVQRLWNERRARRQ